MTEQQNSILTLQNLLETILVTWLNEKKTGDKRVQHFQSHERPAKIKTSQAPLWFRRTYSYSSISALTWPLSQVHGDINLPHNSASARISQL